MQIDDLDLAWEEEVEPGRHRRRARRGGSRGPRRRGRRGRTLLALLLSAMVVAVLGAGIYYGAGKIQTFFAAPDYTTGGSGEVQIEVHKGDTATEIGQTLQENDVVKSAKAFAEAAKRDARSKGIEPGFYRLRHKMRAEDALALMLDPASRIISEATVREGLTYLETYALLSKSTGIPVEQFKEAGKDPVALGVPAFWFTRDDGKTPVKSVEGFLFPAKYQFNPGATATEILKTMVNKFLTVADSLDFARIAQSKGVTPFAALINASLAEAEAGVQADMPKVARVIYNRLNRKPPMALQFDSTTNYWRELHGQPRKLNLTAQENRDPKNPYRTYGLSGLPPGPIGNPGEAALNAAINPTPGQPWLYFVKIDKSGRSAFTDNYQQHLRNIATAKQNGAY